MYYVRALAFGKMVSRKMRFLAPSARSRDTNQLSRESILDFILIPSWLSRHIDEIGYIGLYVSRCCRAQSLPSLAVFLHNASKSRGKHLLRNRCASCTVILLYRLFRETPSYWANEALTLAALTSCFCIVSSALLIELKSSISPASIPLSRITIIKRR